MSSAPAFTEPNLSAESKKAPEGVLLGDLVLYAGLSTSPRGKFVTAEA